MVYESIYEGAKYSLDPGYGVALGKGYNSPASSLSLALDPRTSNQLKEVANKLNTGATQTEVQGVFSKQLEAIPDQHLDEIKRQAKLTGVKLSFHGPLEEPSGFNSDQKAWSEPSREHVERILTKAVERGHKLDPDGNIVITLHSTANLPELLQREKRDGKEVKTSMFVINPQSGGIQQIKEQERFFPRDKTGKEYKFDPHKEMEIMNQEQWTSTLDQFAYHADLAESRGLGEIPGLPGEVKKLLDEGKITKEQLIEKHPEYAKIAELKKSRSSDVYLRSSYNELKNLFDVAYKSAKENKRQGDLATLDKFRAEIIENYDKLEAMDTTVLNNIVQKGIKILSKDILTPEVVIPFQDFVIKKSAETFSNVALNSWKKFGNTSPIISIENPPSGQALSRADDLKKLIEASRKQLTDKLKKEGYGGSESKQIAEKLIGATWDVGHINMIRKFGYEDKDLLEEAKKISPYLKHIHLSDNFGFEHTELPMGMGNVPIKETAKIFGDKFNKLTKVIETGDWYQHFQVSPFVSELSAFGSPVGTNYASQSWNTAYDAPAAYFAGYGTINPDIHHSMWGRGFSSLPQELGGQVPGQEASRTTGTPLA